ncbi:MAG: hypothetical protein KME26_16855 [Oscillatoria princeps RMCB-10]|nr:hypothetical protein [Oscillatoria princeps RMCB-10]
MIKFKLPLPPATQNLQGAQIATVAPHSRPQSGFPRKIPSFHKLSGLIGSPAHQPESRRCREKQRFPGAIPAVAHESRRGVTSKGQIPLR